MLDLLTSTAAQAVAGVLVVVVASAAGFWLVSRLREFSKQDSAAVAELLTNFEELRREGDISATEFRKIQSVLESSADGVGLPRPASESSAEVDGR
jgi:hypothetical protein